MLLKSTQCYLKKCAEKLPDEGATQLAKSNELKDCLSFLVERAPKEMNIVLKPLRQRASALSKALAKKEREEKKAKKEKKRAASTEPDWCRDGKRVKMTAKDKEAAEKSPTATGSVGIRGGKNVSGSPSFPPPPYSKEPVIASRETVLDSDSDDGTEGVTQTIKIAEQVVVATAQFEEIEDGESTEEDDLFEAYQTHLKNQAHPKNSEVIYEDTTQDHGAEVSEANSVSGHTQESTTSNMEDQTESAGQSEDVPDSDVIQAEAELATTIEEGLARGDEETIQKLRDESHILQKSGADDAFKACLRLDPYRLHSQFVDIHREIRAEKARPKKDEAVPEICDLRHPDDIFDELEKDFVITHTTQTVRACGQPRFTDSIYEEIKRDAVEDGCRNKLKTDKWFVDKHEVQERVQGGKHWKDVAKRLGGKSAIMVLIIAEIGPQHIARYWKVATRRAFLELCQYLTGVQKIVRALGDKSLGYFCRHRQLTEEMIAKVENLEMYPGSEEAGGEDEDEESDSEEESDSDNASQTT